MERCGCPLLPHHCFPLLEYEVLEDGDRILLVSPVLDCAVVRVRVCVHMRVCVRVRVRVSPVITTVSASQPSCVEEPQW